MTKSLLAKKEINVMFAVPGEPLIMKTEKGLFYFDHNVHFCWFVGFVALLPKSTALVIAGRSVHLTTLFPGQA